MQIRSLTLKDFTVFAEAGLKFSPGLNVLIGANGTGKSHLLKVLYSVVRPMMSTRANGTANTEFRVRLGHAMLDKLLGTFRATSDNGPLGSLIRHGEETATVDLQGDFGAVGIDMNRQLATTRLPKGKLPTDPSVFVPATEMLSSFEGFIAAYEHRELPFDETFRDLCVALSGTPLRKPSSTGLGKIATTLEDAVGGKTRLRDGKFFVSLSKDWLLEASMLAEGLRKLASIAHLIRNGSLVEKGILFWDEPEANMNPQLIPAVAQVLLGLAGERIQIFAATHDYLLTNELSVAVEYGTPKGLAAKPRFFCLGRSKPREPVTVECGDTLADLQHNPILEEFAAHYDREQALFNQSGAQVGEGDHS